MAARGRIRLSGAEACLAATLAEFGVVRLPGFVATGAIAEGRPQVLLEAFEEPPLPVKALWPPCRHLSPAIGA